MRLSLLCLLLSSAAFAAPEVTAPDRKPRLVVNDLTALRVAPEEASALTDAVVTYLSARGLFEVVGPRDVQTLIGAERQKQLLGTCGDDPLACSLDLSKVVAARFVLSGQLAKVGSAFQLTLQLVDTERSATVSRSSKLSGTLEELRAIVPYAASEATGSPLPPPPSKVLPITLASLGGGTALAGGVIGLLALSREAQLNDELCPGGTQPDARCSGANLRPREFYVQQQGQLVGQKVLGVSLMAAGAVMLGLGIWLMPPDDARTKVGLRMVPTADGVLFAGGFP